MPHYDSVILNLILNATLLTKLVIFCHPLITTKVFANLIKTDFVYFSLRLNLVNL